MSENKMTAEEYFNKADEIVSAIFHISQCEISVKSSAEKQMLYNASKHLGYGATVMLQLSAQLASIAGKDSSMFQEAIKDIHSEVENL